MKTVNVLCAPPNGRNPGMATVDLAFADALQSPGCAVTYWRLWDQSEWKSPVGGSSDADKGWRDHLTGITYQPLRGRLDEFLSADLVFYWGDFLHMAVYLRQNAHVLSHRIGQMDPGVAYGLATDYLLLRGQSAETLSRVMTFGTTLSFNTSVDYAGDYGSDLAQFLRGVNRAWFRDDYSARIAQLERGDSCRGVDAAFLLRPPDLSKAQDLLGVFVGRSALSPERVSRLGRKLAKATRCRGVWIPWGSEPAFWPIGDRKRLRISWPELDHTRKEGNLTDLLEMMGNCRAILTDTYHLAVNAWRLGIPTVCLTDRPTSSWNVNSGANGRDKRMTLYSDLDALPLLVGADQRIESDLVESILQWLENPELLEVVRSRIRTANSQARAELGAMAVSLGSGIVPKQAAAGDPRT